MCTVAASWRHILSMFLLRGDGTAISQALCKVRTQLVNTMQLLCMFLCGHIYKCTMGTDTLGKFSTHPARYALRMATKSRVANAMNARHAIVRAINFIIYYSGAVALGAAHNLRAVAIFCGFISRRRGVTVGAELSELDEAGANLAPALERAERSVYERRFTMASGGTSRKAVTRGETRKRKAADGQNAEDFIEEEVEVVADDPPRPDPKSQPPTQPPKLTPSLGEKSKGDSDVPQVESSPAPTRRAPRNEGSADPRKSVDALPSSRCGSAQRRSRWNQVDVPDKSRSRKEGDKSRSRSHERSMSRRRSRSRSRSRSRDRSSSRRRIRRSRHRDRRRQGRSRSRSSSRSHSRRRDRDDRGRRRDERRNRTGSHSRSRLRDYGRGTRRHSSPDTRKEGKRQRDSPPSAADPKKSREQEYMPIQTQALNCSL